jgi:hypothetical protein
MMQQRLPFFTLSRELRDIIYEYYFYRDDGYVYDFDSKRLKGSSAEGHVIHMDLVYTCKAAAEETRGLALRLNTITFRTTLTGDVIYRARMLEDMANLMEHLHIIMIYAAKKHGCLDLARLRQADFRFPRAIVETTYFNIRRHRDLQTGHAPPTLSQSAARQLYRDMLRLARSHTNFEQVMAELPYFLNHPRVSLSDVLNWEDDREWLARTGDGSHNLIAMWDMPTVNQLEVLREKFDPLWSRSNHSRSNPDLDIDPYIKYRFSAAAVAIGFLGSLPAATRMQVQHVLLDEDFKSSARPECHAIGLVPFCLENPRLRIVRRVDLWRTVLQPPRWQWYKYPASLHPEDSYRQAMGPWKIPCRFKLWADEMASIITYGMPADSFSLVFSGPEDSCQEAFKVLKYAAEWSSAYKQQFYPGFPVDSILEEFNCWEHTQLRPMETLGEPWNPQARPNFHSLYHVSDHYITTIRKIIQGDSLIHFDRFEGGSWDPERILNENSGLEMEKWDWGESEPWGKGGKCKLWGDNVGIETQPPLPSLLEIFRDYITPEGHRHLAGNPLHPGLFVAYD